jgi:tRNA threonylcarbamoyladenosine biosynthesis protein TsaE
MELSEPLVLAVTAADQTRSVAAAMARQCLPGDVLLLAGDLGAGKTTFAQGFAQALGITEPVTSPTFALVRQYPVPGSDVRQLHTLFHADVFRLGHLQEIADLGLGELVEDGGVALVEWGDVAEPVLGEGALSVHLAAGEGGDGHRTITVSAGGAWSGRWEALSSALGEWTVAR